ncbi:MAG: uroporphyrinogen-III synthase [Bacteroidota bacterium]
MKLFISKSKEDSEWLSAFCEEKKWTLEAESLIDFSEIPFEVPTDVEIIFFSSKNGVRYFLEQAELPKGTKTACVGKETARVLRKKNIEPDFIGENSGDPVSVGKDFLKFAGQNNVFFPTSNASLHTIANLLPESQKTVTSIYETKTVSKKIGEADLYIFSSPSNVEGFFKENMLPENARLIAWGLVTERALMDRDFFPEYVLETGQKEELVEYLSKL